MEARMRAESFVVFLLFLLVAPPLLHGQQTESQNSLNETQKEGRLLFQQRCPICHSAVMITRRPYAPVLFKARVVGNEDNVRETIENGRPGRMPAFKYGLSSSEIDAIVQYLETVTAPFEMRPKGQPGAGNSNENASPNATE
jgi:mono/diheme cytochrome c family protein